MAGVIGFWLICCALTFMIAFLMGDSLETKEKIKTSLGIIAVITVMMIGAYLLSEYANI